MPGSLLFRIFAKNKAGNHAQGYGEQGKGQGVAKRKPEEFVGSGK